MRASVRLSSALSRSFSKDDSIPGYIELAKAWESSNQDSIVNEGHRVKTKLKRTYRKCAEKRTHLVDFVIKMNGVRINWKKTVSEWNLTQ